jgi:hypothetical protein
MASPPTSIPDSQLGLTQAEIQLLRYHQQVALANDRSSSRAASLASSQGRLLLDPSSLQALSAHFDRLIIAIQQRWAALYQQTQLATQAQAQRAFTSIEQADAEIERFQEVMRQIGELQTELTKVQRIGEIVKAYRARVEALDRRI